MGNNAKKGSQWSGDQHSKSQTQTFGVTKMQISIRFGDAMDRPQASQWLLLNELCRGFPYTSSIS